MITAVTGECVVREWRCATTIEMVEVLDGISDVKDVPMPIPGYQWRSLLFWPISDDVIVAYQSCILININIHFDCDTQMPLHM
jgi:hypothetical protein